MKQGKILFVLAILLVILVPSLMAQTLGTYKVRINSNAKGADLYVDGRLVGQVPGEFKIPFGKHSFKLIAPGYVDQEQVFKITSNVSMSINMIPGAAPIQTVAPVSEYKVSITSNVNNADIFIDGVLKAKTPAVILLQTGNYNLKVKAAGYADAVQQLAVTADTAYNVTLQSLVVYYTLEVAANLHGARVFVNGKDSGETPVSLSLPEGNYSVKVVKPDFADFEQAVQLNKTTKIMAILQPMTAIVKIIIPPQTIKNGHEQFRKVEVFLDGQRVKDLEFTAPRGPHQVRVASGFLVLETTIDFVPGKIYEIKPALNVEVK